LQRAASAFSPACIGLLCCLHFSTQQPASEKPKAKHVRSFAFSLILWELALACRLSVTKNPRHSYTKLLLSGEHFFLCLLDSFHRLF
jgi:hypothetical protein